MNEVGVSLSELYPIIAETLSKNGRVEFISRGISMLPMLGDGKNKVVLTAIDGEPCVGDVIFYRRADGSFILHRIVGRNKEGFVCRGDNQIFKEKGVKREWIIARLEGFWNKEEYLDSKSFYTFGYRLRIGARRWVKIVKAAVKRLIGGKNAAGKV